MGKLVEKVIAEQLSQLSENFLKLHQGQMGARKERCAIDAVASLVYEVEQRWAEKKLAAALFMGVKGAFDHVSKTQLVAQMLELEIDGDLIRWTKSFLTNRKLQLVIDGHNNPEKDVETGIPQGSPVSPILFLIYISGIFEQVEKELPEIVSLSFVDDLGFIASGTSVKEIAKALGKVGNLVVKWGRRHAVTYDMAKTKLVLFSRARQRRLNQQLRETTVLVGGERIKLNKDATRWLGIWLDSQLKFTAHINERLTKAKTAKIQVKRLSGTYGLAPGLVRQIQLQQFSLLRFMELSCGGEDRKPRVQGPTVINRQARVMECI